MALLLLCKHVIPHTSLLEHSLDIGGFPVCQRSGHDRFLPALLR